MINTLSWQIGYTLRWTSASWVTLSGLALALIGMILFSMGFEWQAVSLLILSFLTDWFDGCVARFHQGTNKVMSRAEEDQLSIWERLNYKGVTHFGRALDPLVDKVRFIGLIWIVGPPWIPTEVLIGITTMAVLLTLLRPIKRWMRLDHAGANAWGKRKVYAEVVLITALVFGTRPLYGRSHPFSELERTQDVIEALGYLSLLLACASAYVHIENGYTYWYIRRYVTQPSPKAA